MKYSSSFTHDLSYGETGEDWVHDILSNGGKVEVKTDRMTHKTGNVFIEYACRHKPSGIATTTANYWYFKFDKMGVALVFEVDKLKDICRKFYFDKEYMRDGGDNNLSKGFLVPVRILLNKSI